MSGQFVSWKDWASSQVTIAMLEMRIKTVEQKMDRLETQPPVRTGWLWWAQIVTLASAAIVLILANIEEKLALAILDTMKAIFGR